MRVKRVLVGALTAGALMALTPQCGDDWMSGVAGAQVITSDPIQTVPGFPGCGGNQTQQDVTTTYTCANQRTFHFGAATRTVVAVSTLNADGSAFTTYTITGGTAPADVPLTIRAWSGVSAGGTLFSTVSGVIPKGTAGPVTLSYTFDCGQIDVKAVFTSTSNGNGRISGGFFCKPMAAPATTVPNTAPSSAPGPSVAPTTAPLSSTPSGPGATVKPAVVGTLPPTGGGGGNALPVALVGLSVGVLLVVGARRRAHA